MKSNWLLCLAAGLAGGFISHIALSLPVHAQNKTGVVGSSPAPPQIYTPTPEIHAQEFILLDSKGQEKASIKMGNVDGTDVIEILNASGQVVFTAGSSAMKLLTTH